MAPGLLRPLWVVGSVGVPGVGRREAPLTLASAAVPSTLSQCIHAAAALLYPFSWAHTYIPVVPESLLATVCCPTPFMVGVQMRFLQDVLDSPMEEVGPARRSRDSGPGRPVVGAQLCSSGPCDLGQVASPG